MGLNQDSLRNSALLKVGMNSSHGVQLPLFSLRRQDSSHYVMVSDPPLRCSLTPLHKNSSLLIKASVYPWETFESFKEFLACAATLPASVPVSHI